MTTLASRLEQRAESALRRADNIAATSGPFDTVRSVELEQHLDDADRYARLHERMKAYEQRTATGPYARGDHSVIGDLLNRNLDPDAGARLKLLGWDEQRKGAFVGRLGTGAVIGLVPPSHLTQAVATQVAAGRPLADRIGSRPLPEQGMTVETGRVTTGNSAAAQTAENTAASSTTIVVAGISIPVRTIATTTTVSRQLYERAAGAYRDGLLGDMLEAHANTVDALIITGTGASGQPTGYLAQASTQSTAYASVSPTGAEFIPKLAANASAASTARRRPVTTHVMHSRRWLWLASRVEAGLTMVGDRSVFGNEVIIDNNIPTNLGAGTDEDRVISIIPEDHHLYESPVYVLAGIEGSATASAGVTVTVYSYVAFTAARYPQGVGILTGTGLNAVAT